MTMMMKSAGDSHIITCSGMFICRCNSSLFKGLRLLQITTNTMLPFQSFHFIFLDLMVPPCHIFPCHILAFGCCLNSSHLCYNSPFSTENSSNFLGNLSWLVIFCHFHRFFSFSFCSSIHIVHVYTYICVH